MLFAYSFGVTSDFVVGAAKWLKFSMKLTQILSFGVMLEPRYIFRAGPLDQ
jgi:hypothetical protein